MTTSADFTTRARTEMFNIYTAYQALQRRVQDLSDEVSAVGVVNLYGAAGVDFPEQGDGFEYADMVAAFTNIGALVGEPTAEEKQTIIRARRS